MQLKYKRYTGQRGMISKETTYCLDVLAHLSDAERERIDQYDRWKSMVWILGDMPVESDDNEEYRKHIMRVSIRDVANGCRFEYSNFNNVLRTENIIAEACKQVLATVNTLATFDGSERVVEVDEDEAAIVAAG